jgi:hypothetical protein
MASALVVSVLLCSSAFCGLVAFSSLGACDPVQEGTIDNASHLTTLLAAKFMSATDAMLGLFVASLLAAAMA